MLVPSHAAHSNKGGGGPYDQGGDQGDRILNFQQSQQGAALVDDSRADNEITLKSPIYVVTGD
jgi:hypothetical protein